MDKQKTIGRSIVVEGIGLHTGSVTKVVIKPAPCESGVVFVRADMNPGVSIPATVEHTCHGEGRQTGLASGAARIFTIEHLMAVFHGLGVDNAIVEVSGGPEMPGMDGSAKSFTEKVLEAGLVEQDAPRHYVTLKEPITVEEDGQIITAYPSENGLELSYQLSYNHPDLADQFFSTKVTPEIFKTELSSARTFCLRQEAEYLRANGYGKGATVENTLVFEKNVPIQNTLRFSDEACRHKVLDLLGDLYLLGRPLKARVVASKTGHEENSKLVKKIIEHTRSEKTSMSTDISVTPSTPMDVKEIQKILPHRYPFLLVDRIVSVEPGKKAVGIKNVTINEHFFQGHFPDHPIMPGVLILEALAQVGGVLMLSDPQNKGKLAYFMTIDNAKFRQGVFPGDQLRLEAELIKFRSRTGQCTGHAYVNDKLVCEAEVKFAIVDPA